MYSDATGSEVAKNIILSGIGKVTLADDSPCTDADFDVQWALTNGGAATTRGAAAYERLARLNPYITTTLVSEEEAMGIVAGGDVSLVMFSTTTPDSVAPNSLARVAAAREAGVKAIVCGSGGRYSWFAQDLGTHEFMKKTVETMDGESKETSELATHTYPSIAEGFTWVSDPSSNIEDLPKAIRAPFARLSVTAMAATDESFAPHPSLFAACPDAEARSVAATTADATSQKLVAAWMASRENLSPVLSEEIGSGDFVRSLTVGRTELATTGALMGGLIGAEIIKIISASGEPYKNWFFYDGATRVGHLAVLPPPPKVVVAPTMVVNLDSDSD